jgi:hypothetical protein
VTKLDSRIYRADQRMVQAKCAKWCLLWRRMFYRLVDRRNAMAMVRAVRHPGSARDELPGLRQEGKCPVAATSGKQSMSSFLDMQMAAK